MPIYITDPTVLTKDPALKASITKGQLTTDNINSEITEAETYVEGRLLQLGYVRAQLIAAPNTPAALVLSLIILYTRYVVMRDVYSGNSPSEGTGMPYDKWKTQVEEMFDLMDSKDSKNRLRIVDNNGVLINPSVADNRFKVLTTTPDAARIFTLDKSSTWKNDPSNSASDVVGTKPGLVD